jgi:hypothetical protein
MLRGEFQSKAISAADDNADLLETILDALERERHPVLCARKTDSRAKGR